MKERWEATPGPPGAIATTAEVWQYRRLLSFIGDRALRKTYRRTILGWLWLFINPLFPIALRALIFGGLLGVGSNGLPYFLFLLAGTVAWDVFAASLMWGTRALEMHSDLTIQIYHPRAILPLGNSTAIKLTTARYYTPNGRSIQAKGIVPDIILDDGTAGRDPALKLRESDLDKHLSNDRTKDEKGAAGPATPIANAFNFTPTARPKDVDEKDTKPEPGEVVAKSDYELAQAIAFLKSRGTTTRASAR